MQSPRPSRLFIPAVIGVSLVARVLLALQGGQYFFGDEGRYDRGIQLYRALASADWMAVRTIAAMPEHALFPWVGALVTAGQHVLAHFTPYGDWSHPEFISFTMKLGAAVLSLFSALNLLLVHRLARVAGATAEEAGWALLTMAASNTAFYYARHLLPYDCALAAALGALVVGLSRPTVTRALACGLLGGVTYGLYNGYWFLVPVVWLMHLLAWRKSDTRGPLAAWCAAGTVIGLAVPVAIGSSLGGAEYWTTLRSFSGTVTQGVFSEGWSLPWDYLWQSEGMVGAAVIAAIALAWAQTRRTRAPIPAWVSGSLQALALSYVLLVLLSNGLERFVVYARTVKPFIPLLCLPAGWAFARLFAGQPRLRPFVVVAFALVALGQFAPHFTRVFPREVEIDVLRHYGNPKRALSVTGSLYIPLALPVTRPDLALVNAQLLYPVRETIAFPPGPVLLRIAHPLSYEPFQYEGHAPRERALLRAHDISIQLIQLADPASVPDHPPPAQLYQNADRPTGR